MIDTSSPNMALAGAFAQELARCGVRLAVISPGSRSTPLAVALYRQAGIETEVVIDERSAGFFALGAAQATGSPVALVCTSGTAAANYHPAVAEADLSAVPLLVLTADRPPELRDTGAGQAIDQIKLYGQAVRWFCEVGSHDADDTGLIFFRSLACRATAAAAGDPRPGPVHLNFPFRDPLDPTPEGPPVTAKSELALTGGADGSPLTAVRQAPAAPTDAITAELAELIERQPRGLILAGRQTDPDLTVAVARLADRAGYPLLAEPTSQMRCEAATECLIWAYDRIARESPSELAPRLVIRFGEFPTSKPLRRWFGSLPDLRQVVVDHRHGWHEPTRTAELVLRTDPALTATALAEASTERTERGFERAWREADRDAAGAIAGEHDPENLTGAALHHAIGAAYRDGDLIYTNSSLPIREQEENLPPVGDGVTFLANRGANGIDGLIASGIGAARASRRPVLLLTGDVALQHDLGSLACWKQAGVAVRILVINNGGGAIFDRLPQRHSMPAQEFADLMSTPPAIEPRKAAELVDLPYRELTDLDRLADALDGGSALIELKVPAY